MNTELSLDDDDDDEDDDDGGGGELVMIQSEIFCRTRLIYNKIVFQSNTDHHEHDLLL